MEVSQYIFFLALLAISLICPLRVIWNFLGTLLEEAAQEEGQSVDSLCLGKDFGDCSRKH